MKALSRAWIAAASSGRNRRPRAGRAGLDQAVVVDPTLAGGHGDGPVAEQRVVRPQRRADEARAGDDQDLAIEQVDARPGANRPAGGEALLQAAVIVLVVAGHEHDRPPGQARRRRQAVHGALGRAVDVPGDHRDVEERESFGQRPSRPVLEVQVGQDEEADHAPALCERRPEVWDLTGLRHGIEERINARLDVIHLVGQADRR